MKRIFTWKLAKLSFLALALFTSSFAFSQTCIQTQTCADVDVTFDSPNNGGNTFGFLIGSGYDFHLEGANSPNANSDFFLESTPVSEGTTKLLSSPIYSAPLTGTIDYTFTLSGNANVTSYEVYIVTAGGTRTLLCNGIPVYENQGPAKICGIAGFTPSFGAQQFRFEFVFQIEGSNSHTLKFDDFGSSVISEQIPLPVNFLDFFARTSGSSVTLTWKVGVEQNLYAYEIERSTNGISFTKIGSIHAEGLSNYSFTTSQSAAIVYYRIKSVDVDGRFKYSTVVSLKNGKSVVLIRAYPLPAKNGITVQHGALNEGQINITTVEGKLVKSLNASSDIQTAVDISALQAGLYIIRITDKNGLSESIKMIKQ